MKNLKKIILTTALISNIAAFSNINASSDKYNYPYIGLELGVAIPPPAKIKIADTEVEFKSSFMGTGKIGYCFYPGQSIEFSATFQPKFKMVFDLPDTPDGQGGKLKHEIDDIVVKAQVYMINFLYEFFPSTDTRPYFIVGGGLAHVSNEQKSSNEFMQGVSALTVKKHSKNYFAFQAGLGVMHDITDNLSMDFTVKAQMINNIKIDYTIFDTDKQKKGINPPFTDKTHKQTVPVLEITTGLSYKF